MKNARLTRRQLFKLSAGASALALAPAVAAPSREATAAAEQPRQLAVPQPTFNAIASATAFGPPVDISMGWDGVLWAIDASGSPHVYDSAQDAWLAHGDGIDAAAAFDGVTYFFRGAQVLQVNAASGAATLTTIAAAFPKLPDSFKLRVTGAVVVDSALILINGGRYVKADGSVAPRNFADIPLWPKTAPWQDGLATGAYYDTTGVYLFNGNEYVNFVSLYDGLIVSLGHGPISGMYNWGKVLPAAWLSGGVDAALPTPTGFIVFKGTGVAQFGEFDASPASPAYLPAAFANWPATWNPQLRHAPSGRVNDLWCATTGGAIIRHDGEQWNATPGTGNTAAVGQDGAVMTTNSVGLYRWNGTEFDLLGAFASPVQVAVGDAAHVWVRDASNIVRRYDAANGFTAVDLGAGVPNPTHMAANADGTLWHCASGNANAFRLISEAVAPSAQITLKGAGVVSSVERVASTGFGAAHCLARHSDGSINVYRYDSPYMFKTATSYSIWSNPHSTMVNALGRVFFVTGVYDPLGETVASRVSCVDAHTGVELASVALPDDTAAYTGLAFDPVNALLYVGSAPLDNYSSAPGSVIALDARTLSTRWTYQTRAGVDGTPVLQGSQLCFGDRSKTLTMLDTRAALASGAAPAPQWTWTVSNAPASTHRVSTPAISGGRVFATVWDLSFQSGSGGQVVGGAYLAACDAATGANGSLSPGDVVVDNINRPLLFQLLTPPPALGRVRADDQSTELDAVYINNGFSVHVFSLVPGRSPITASFKLPSGQVSTSVVFDEGSRLGPNGLPQGGLDPTRFRVWFGDNTGNLWSLGDWLVPTDHTPVAPVARGGIFAGPTLYKDPQGGLTVLFGVLLSQAGPPPSVYGYDPDNGNLASLPTGVTGITAITPTVSNGLLYAGGRLDQTNPDNLPAQVFALRLDALPQGLRDFVIESQLMQDPEPGAPNSDPANDVPPSVARYQTHLTVVDEAKNPIAREAIKIWSDTPGTRITIDGVAYTVGPGDGDFASVQTGVDGALVITTDAADYFAPVLRAWASFMDPFERIVIHADAEFHQRVMTAHVDPTDDDPGKVNLQTAVNYKGQPLFTADEKGANPPVPAQVAKSIQTANTGLGLSKRESRALHRRLTRALGVKHKNQRIQVQLIEAAPQPDRYLAYADLPGAAHFPANTPAQRLATIAQPIGLSFARPNGDQTKLPVAAQLTHQQARDQIDALAGEPWQPTDPTGGPNGFRPQRAFNIFQDFWNWLKGLFDKILQCILSIAEDILAGIQYFLNGVLKVFKAIIKVLEDVFPFLGSFFKMLEKAIDDVVMAMSVLFNFGEIMWTHRWLADQFQARVNDLTGAIKGTIQPAVDAFFSKGEAAIRGYFDSVRAQLGTSGNPSVSNLKGVGQTPHTAFTVGPRNGPQSSQAAQCTWGVQKLKVGLPAATTAAAAGSMRASAALADPVNDFLKSFFASLSSDPNLKAAIAQLNADFSSLLNVKSVSQFFNTLLVTLLDIVETLLIGVLSVADAFLDGLFAVITDAINAVVGMLNAEIDVPVLAWLYEALFKEKLTLLNLVTLVAAIPATIVFRVVEGQYPSQAKLPPASALQAMNAQAAPQGAQIVIGIFVSAFQLVLGSVNAVNEAEDAAPALGYVSLGCGLMIEAFSFPLIANDAKDVSAPDWAVYGIGVGGVLLGLAGVSYTGSDGQPTSELDWSTVSVLTCILGLNVLGAGIWAYVEDGKTDGATNAEFAELILGAIDGIVNPAKLSGGESAVLVAAMDVLTGIAELFITLIVTIVNNASSAPPPRRLHFPFVPVRR